MSDLVFNPMISLSIMGPYTLIMIVIIIFNRKNVINRILIILLILIISQRPMLKNQDEITYSMDLDIIFVIDNTVSMNAADVNNVTRLNAVKRDCLAIIDKFSGANFAIITYGNIAEVRYPLTNDLGIIKDIITRLKIIDPVYATGSTLDLPYDYLKMFLESSASKEKHKRIVFFMGDGELSKEDANNTRFGKYLEIKDLINSGAVLCYGSTTGAKIKITESVNLKGITDSQGYLLDSKTMKSAISKINESNMKIIANNLDLKYYHVTEPSVISNEFANINKEAIEQNEEEKEKMNKDIYYYFSGALLVLLLLELYHYRRNEQ